MDQQFVPPSTSSPNVQFTNLPDGADYGVMNIGQAQLRHRNKFVLCFDGTGNKFSGTDADSNILKIYRMLDRDGDDQYHYYQPGIGTYVTRASGSMTRTGRYERFKSWYAKAKDSAVGTSFDLHVMAGYRFLMRYYSPGDDIFFFGFSRGAYTARFLAEMLDHVGLLSAGNEEMCQFAWKTFQKWQCRLPDEEGKLPKPGEKSEKRKLLDFMCAFRETFSRPVRPIRFLGLFDTVNSVPHFENAWMQRSKFPYTAQSSARVIRHAVSIDERRAKFRQDLIGEQKPDSTMYYKRRHKGRHLRGHAHGEESGDEKADEERRREEADRGRRDTLAPPERHTPHISPAARGVSPRSITPSMVSMDPAQAWNLDEDEGEQDIQEVWFPGCHADIGGGWPLSGDDAALSHVPLVWMVREAQRAGLEFDEDKLDALSCCYEQSMVNKNTRRLTIAPTIEIDPASPEPATDAGASPFDLRPNGNNNATTDGSIDEVNTGGWIDEKNFSKHHKECEDTPFHKHLHYAATQGRIHDVLQFNNGVTSGSVISWNIMEYMPFRRMDLQKDGTWKAITWPLPKGETRDIPANATIHSSVIKRMVADPTYRPGNLIVGGGGRGVRTAPKKDGIGKWIVLREDGNAIGECFVRKELPKRQRTDEKLGPPVVEGAP